ncbi:hypothetical protein [Neobittarella massiliensis]|uniref:hypothetical protein n=1 Tax=Neobittarella massiliensis (ex Bilen et al. 2018) TaxID=2041842 RepID=UPI000CF6D227|nr:hypothetical protein [Neobittarella massiliensis]
MFLMTIILVGCDLIGAGCVLYNMLSSARCTVHPGTPSRLLGVTLPGWAVDDPQVTTLVTAYKKTCWRAFWLSLLPLVPLPLLEDYPSLGLLHTIFYYLLVLWGGSALQKRWFGRLYALKQKNVWVTGEPVVATIDITEQPPAAISPWWLLPSLLVAVGMFLHALLAAGLAGVWQPVFAGTHLAVTLGFCALFFWQRRAPKTTFSKDPAVNTACNAVSRQLYTGFWAGLAAADSLLELILYFILFGTAPSSWAVLTALLALSLAPLLGYLYIGHRVQAAQRQILALDTRPAVCDDDVYWLSGHYYNPRDSRYKVEPRPGFQNCYNMATAGGRRRFYAMVAGILLFCGAICLFLVRMDFTTAEIALSPDRSTVEIDAAGFDWSFATGEVQSLAVSSEHLSGTRVGGASSRRYNFGNFNLKGYGPSRVYTYASCPWYIAVELPDKWVFLSLPTQQQTKQLLDELQRATGLPVQ